MNAELKIVDLEIQERISTRLPDDPPANPDVGFPASSSRLADALLSRTQQQVLGLLFGSPQRAFNASDIIQRAGCGSGTVQRELARLHDCGILTQTRTGLQKRYQVNTQSPVYASLRALMVTLQSPWLGLQELLASLPGQLAFAAVQPPQTDATTWLLVLVADELTLQQVYSAVRELETQQQCRFAVTLHTPADWQALTPAQRDRLCPTATTMIFSKPTRPVDALP